MKKVLFISLAVLGIGMAGCSNEDLGVAQKGNDEVTASIGTEESRTAMQENSVVWCANDQIGIFAQTSDEGITHQAYTLSGGVGTKNATFQGYLEGSNPVKKVAYYPYNTSATYSNSIVLLTLKDNYTYVENENSGAPMACLINESAQGILSFKNAGALMNITVNNIPAGYNKVTLTSKAGGSNGTVPDITGKAQIAFDTDGVPSLTMVSGESNGKTITISFTAEGSLTSKSFYFPLPVADYPALELAIGNGSDTKVLKTKALDATRNMRYTTTITLDEVSGNVPAEVTSASDASTALASNNSVSIADVLVTENNPTVTIPEKEADNVSISFDNISTTNAIAIKGADGASNMAKNVLVSAPQLDSAPKFEITLPESTVTLAANGATATYAEVTATTAENTLIVGKGVTVNNLIVKAGNVRIKSGGTVTAISRSGENSKVVKIYVEDGANYPSGLDASIFTVQSAEIADLNAIAKDGGEYTLNSEIILSEPLVVEGVMTLDLNGHSLKANSEGLTQVLNTRDAVVLVRRNAHLIINDSSNGKGSINYNGAGSVYTAVKLTDVNDGATGEVVKLTVNGGLLKGYYYGICGNGTRHGTETIINGGTITVAEGDGGAAIYHPQDGALTVNNGAIIGKDTGIEMRSGTLTVNGGTIKSTATNFNEGPNGDGTTLTGAAVAISQHTTDKELKAIINEGTLEGIYALYEKDLQNATGAKSLQVTAGTFIGGVFSEDCSAFITGGTFSDPGALAYLGDNADVTVRLAANTELEKSMIVEKGTATIDLNNHTLTAVSSATVEINKGKYAVVAIAVKDGAKATIENGNVGDDSNNLSYGVYAFGKADVTLNNIIFGTMDTYAYNGAGKLTATSCTFKGWLSGWHHGGTFSGCTFTIGKGWYPAAICYGSTTFTNCKFFKNNIDADKYDDNEKADNDGFYRCCYVVAQCDPSKSIGFTGCKFIDADNAETGSVAIGDHPFHACGWGDGTSVDYSITVDGAAVTSYCSDKTAQMGTND